MRSIWLKKMNHVDKAYLRSTEHVVGVHLGFEISDISTTVFFGAAGILFGHTKATISQVSSDQITGFYVQLCYFRNLGIMKTEVVGVWKIDQISFFLNT